MSLFDLLYALTNCIVELHRANCTLSNQRHIVQFKTSRSPELMQVCLNILNIGTLPAMLVPDYPMIGGDDTKRADDTQAICNTYTVGYSE